MTDEEYRQATVDAYGSDVSNVLGINMGGISGATALDGERDIDPGFRFRFEDEYDIFTDQSWLDSRHRFDLNLAMTASQRQVAQNPNAHVDQSTLWKFETEGEDDVVLTATGQEINAASLDAVQSYMLIRTEGGRTTWGSVTNEDWVDDQGEGRFWTPNESAAHLGPPQF